MKLSAKNYEMGQPGSYEIEKVMKSSPKGYEMKYIGSHEISPGKE
jgi:hypothetical protein